MASISPPYTILITTSQEFPDSQPEFLLILRQLLPTFPETADGYFFFFFARFARARFGGQD